MPIGSRRCWKAPAAGVKLASVATDIQGVSAQAILRAMLDGQTDVKVLAELAKGRLRNKRAELERALKGQITPPISALC